MTIEQADKIDFLTCTCRGEVLLSISDHLPWDEQGRHLLLLQEKLNAYLRFIEGGELKQKNAWSAGLPIILHLVIKFDPSKQGSIFLAKAKDAVAKAGYELRIEMMQPN